MSHTQNRSVLAIVASIAVTVAVICVVCAPSDEVALNEQAGVGQNALQVEHNVYVALDREMSIFLRARPASTQPMREMAPIEQLMALKGTKVLKDPAFQKDKVEDPAFRKKPANDEKPANDFVFNPTMIAENAAAKAEYDSEDVDATTPAKKDHLSPIPGGYSAGPAKSTGPSWHTIVGDERQVEHAEKIAQVAEQPTTGGVKLAEHLVAEAEAAPVLTGVNRPKQKQVKTAPKSNPETTVHVPVAPGAAGRGAALVTTKQRAPVATKQRAPVATKQRAPVATKQSPPVATKQSSPVATAQLKPKVHLALEKAAAARKVAHLQRVTKRKELKYKKAMRAVQKLQPAGDKA
jgi:hypothetical protein